MSFGSIAASVAGAIAGKVAGGLIGGGGGGGGGGGSSGPLQVQDSASSFMRQTQPDGFVASPTAKAQSKKASLLSDNPDYQARSDGTDPFSLTREYDDMLSGDK